MRPCLSDKGIGDDTFIFFAFLNVPGEHFILKNVQFFMCFVKQNADFEHFSIFVDKIPEKYGIVVLVVNQLFHIFSAKNQASYRQVNLDAILDGKNRLSPIPSSHFKPAWLTRSIVCESFESRLKSLKTGSRS